MAIEFGFGRADITAFEAGMTMMGWGQRTNRAEGVAAPLHARALMLRDPASGVAAALVVTETLVVTQGLWWGVLDALEAEHPEWGLGAHNVVLSATHTHSGPSGFGHHFWPNLSAPGWSAPVYGRLRDGILGALKQAHQALRPGRAVVSGGEVPLSAGISFNRAWSAYNRNPDVSPVTRERRDEATDREATLLRFEDADGHAVGAVHWLGLHGTCVHADNALLHPDHKGLAALALEADGLDVVFAQESAGDVTPNYRWDRRRGHTMGRYDDDLESAAYVGGVQADHARELLRALGTEATGPLQVATRYLDVSRAPVSPRWSPDGTARVTAPARLGLSMASGTREGPGPLGGRLEWVPRALSGAVSGMDRVRSRVRRGGVRRHDPKVPFVDLGRGNSGRVAGLLPVKAMPGVDPTFKWVRDQVRSGAVHEGSWVPHVVPLQLIRLGPLVIAALPFETTTVSGRRLRATIREALPGVERVVLTTYASAYVGYLTTFEEYQVQRYEGGYTLFGPFTLAALQTAFAELAADLGRHDAPLGEPPPRVPVEVLDRMAFAGPWPD